MVLMPKVTLKGAGRGYTDVRGIVLPTEDFETLEDVLASCGGDPAAVLLTGPAGTAKTMLVRAFAAYLGVPYLKIDAGAVRTADDWAGAFRRNTNTKNLGAPAVHLWRWPFVRASSASSTLTNSPAQRPPLRSMRSWGSWIRQEPFWFLMPTTC